MLHFFRLLVFLIKMDQETVLNWFEINNLVSNTQNNDFTIIENNVNFLNVSVESSTPTSFETLKLLIATLIIKFTIGFSLEDIEFISFFILFVRFLILTIKYNLKTSFFIICIAIFAGFLWYRHLVNVLIMYKSIIILPIIQSVINLTEKGLDGNRSNLKYFTDIDSPTIPWYNVGELIYYAFLKGVINLDKETGNMTYIDPVSMTIARLSDTHKARLEDIYYVIYNRIFPKAFELVSRFWSQLSGVAAYALITRIGKRYCPYLIRWHWTFLLLFKVIEQFIVYFVYRLYYFKTFVIGDFTYSEVQSIITNGAYNKNIFHIGDLALHWPSEVNIVEGMISFVVVSHIGFVIFGLLNAISGQYFYVPFLVPNTELHVGQRPRDSIYSGGNTPWQYPDSPPIGKWQKFRTLMLNFVISSLVKPKVILRYIGIMIYKFISSLFREKN